MKSLGRLRAAALLAAGCMVLAACSESSGGASDTTQAGGDNAASVTWMREYTGGSDAEASGDAVKIGFASTSDFFPNVSAAAEATVAYLNTNAGGVGGRPIELVSCNLATPEDGTKCGTQFANDPDIVMAMVGSALVGTGDFYKALDGKKPVYNFSPTGTDDFVTNVSVSYANGALGASLGIASFVVADLKAPSIAVLITDDAAGRGGFAVIEPILKSGGATVTPVFVKPTATAPEVEAALQAVKVTEVNTLIVGVFEQGCIAAYDALKSLGVDATTTNVVAVKPCVSSAVQQHLKDAGDTSMLPNGWYFTGTGPNLFVTGENADVDAAADVLASAGKSDLMYSVAVDSVIGGVATMAKHLNAANGDFSFDTLNNAIRSFTGPAMLQAGALACGTPPVFKGVCSFMVSFHRYLDNAWVETRAGDNSVDITPFLTAPPPAG